jgi:uncharacterized small protein (DUF1192 family)
MADNLQLDVQKIVDSLSSQVAQQAQRIAILEATIAALNSEIDAKKSADQQAS